MIKLAVDNVYSALRGLPDKGVNDAIWEACTYEVEAAQHMKRAKKKFKRWDGSIKLYHRSRHTFPTGLLTRVRGILDANEIEYQIEYAHHPVTIVGLPKKLPGRWTARDYQQDAIKTAIEVRRCMIRMATGGGKTVVAGHLIHRIDQPAIFLVHTKDLLYQAKDAFLDMFGERYVGQIGDGIVDIKAITVCTIQTASRALGVKFVQYEYEEGEDAWKDEETSESEDIVRALRSAGVVFMDECHRVAAPTAMDVLAGCTHATYRFGLSASPWRDDGADLALEAVFGHVAYEISASELIGQGHLVPPIIRFLSVPAQGYPKGTKYSTVYQDYVVENDYRNGMVVSMAQSMMERGRQTLILVRHIKHGEQLQYMLAASFERSIPFLSGDDPSSLRNAVLRDLRADRLPGLIATTIADEGLDVKPLAGLVLAGGGKSSVRALQRVGRVLRPWEGKRNAEVVDFEDNAKYLVEHTAARQRIYRTEPAWTITDV